MTEDQFWEIIARSLKGLPKNDSYERLEKQSRQLQSLIMDLPVDEIYSFEENLRQLFWKAYRWDLWGAAVCVLEGASDDGFAYFRYWLIAQGKNVYNETLKDPEYLVKLSNPVGEYEDIGTMAGTCYEEKSGAEMPEVIVKQPDEPLGKRWERKDFPKLYPKLIKKFGNPDED